MTFFTGSLSMASACFVIQEQEYNSEKILAALLIIAAFSLLVFLAEIVKSIKKKEKINKKIVAISLIVVFFIVGMIISSRQHVEPREETVLPKIY